MTYYPAKHPDGTTDSRWTVTAEANGTTRPYEIRFCGEWVDAFTQQRDAVKVCAYLAATRAIQEDVERGVEA